MEGQWGLFSATASSISLAIMIVFDRIMIGDCYRDLPRQAWLVSSLSGSIFGLIATLTMWVVFSDEFERSVFEVGNLAIALFFPWGLAMLLAGAVSNQVLCHYFRLFVPQAGRAVDETAIALWLSLAPMGVFAASSLLAKAGVPWFANTGLVLNNTSWTYGFAVVGAVVALASFELCGTDRVGIGDVRSAEIAKMLGAVVVYTLTVSSILRAEGIGGAELLALQPYYWIGFSSGIRVLTRRDDRTALKANIRRLTKFLPVITVAEIIGMAVYMFEFVALGGTDPTLVNLILSAHVLAVFGLSLALSLLRRRMERQGRRRVWLFGIRLLSNKLPAGNVGLSKVLRLGCVQIMLLLAIFLS
jgi:hypothetical protein